MALHYPDNKVLQRSQIDLQIKKKKSRHKKVTGFQVLASKEIKISTFMFNTEVKNLILV